MQVSSILLRWFLSLQHIIKRHFKTHTVRYMFRIAIITYSMLNKEGRRYNEQKRLYAALYALKVHNNENFYGSDFEICVFS
jgi:hypothetical protein